MLSHQAETTGKVSVFPTVKRLRKQRVNMVQTVVSRGDFGLFSLLLWWLLFWWFGGLVVWWLFCQTSAQTARQHGTDRGQQGRFWSFLIVVVVVVVVVFVHSFFIICLIWY